MVTHHIISLSASMGEFTQADDMPSSGSITKELYSLGFYYEATAADGNPHGDQVLTDGQGSLEFDFTTNTVSGSIDYRTFIPYTNFSAGETTYDLITSVSGQTLTYKMALFRVILLLQMLSCLTTNQQRKLLK